MSDEAPRRPLLAVALEDLSSACHNLHYTTQAYTQARGLLEQLSVTPDAPIEDAGLMLIIGELKLPLPMPTDAAQRIALLDEAVQQLGVEVVRLWRVAHETTSRAAEHCGVATAAAAAAGASAR